MIVRCGLASLLAAMIWTAQSPKPLLLSSLTASRTHIAFAFANDLWIVSRDGGEAIRLTKGFNVYLARFSPDGNEIALSGGPSENGDVYILPIAGGVPRRLTYHPGGSEVAGWTPDGKSVLFTSDRSNPLGNYRLFTIPREGGPATELPLDIALEGSFSPDQRKIAFVPFATSPIGWKGYRGGETSPIWIADLSDSRVEKIPRVNSNDFNPMWIGHQIYFLSDRNGSVRLFSYDVATRKISQVDQDRDWDIESASAGPDAIVFMRGGFLNLFDLRAQQSKRINIRITGDFPELKAREMNVAGQIRRAGLSPSGDCALFEARGEILTLGAQTNQVRDLTNTPGVRETSPLWSPDGTRIAYFSDESGEYQLHIRSAEGTGEVTKIALGDPPSFYFSPVWSPDSKKIAFCDKRLNLWFLDVDKGQPVRIDSDTYQERFWLRVELPPPSWSPDSRWLTYSKLMKNWLRAVFVYSLDSGQKRQITDGLVDVRYPQFDVSGEFLYFASSSDIGPTIGDEMSAIGKMPTRNVHLVVLRKGEPSPIGAEESQGIKPSDRTSRPVQIDFEGIEDRIETISVPARNYVSMAAGEAGTLYLFEAASTDPYGLPPGRSPSNIPLTLYQFDLAANKSEKLAENVSKFAVSHDGKKVLYRLGERWAIASSPTADKPSENWLDMKNMQVRIDPVAEWRQMYDEVWRTERDFFYDPGYHGLDLKSAKSKYAPFLENIVTSRQLSSLFYMMLGEFGVSHIGAYGGVAALEQETPATAATGLLGADYEIANGRYRFKRIYHRDPWDRNIRAPLAQPGIAVEAGEYLLAVEGHELHASDNLYTFFEGKADRPTILTVGPDPEGKASRTLTVVPVDSEYDLRSQAWIEDNRRKVDRMTRGRVAYIYMANTAALGKSAFLRMFYAQADKEAVIIDERFNGGGAIADSVIQDLGQSIRAYIATRDGEDFSSPLAAIPGPKVMIINEGAFSGGDILPYLFRRAGLGPLIGKRTGGGMVGAGGLPSLMGGGSVSAPNNALYTPEGRWVPENEGISPDIEVDQDPAAVRAGHDPQLEKAIDVVMAALKKMPPRKATRPAYKSF